MKPAIVFLMLIIVAAAAVGGYLVGQHHAAPIEHNEESATTQPDEEKRPPIAVKVEPLKQGTISQKITAYGTVVAQAGDVQIVSAPFESRVTRVFVSPGQNVSPGADLLAIEPSLDAAVGLVEAQNAFAAAEAERKNTQQRFENHLATNTELASAKVAAQSAQLKLNALTQRGAGKAQTIKAGTAGIVSKLDVQPGQIAAAGTALIELAAGSRIQVVLGVEPSDATALKIGQPVKISVAGETASVVEAKIAMIAQRIDPATRLTSVVVALPPEAHLMLDTYVQGGLARTIDNALIVPRDAALPKEDGGYVVFTAENDHAKAHDVRLGIENESDAQIIADDLKPGDPIIVQGNYQLEDGGEIMTEAPAATQAEGAQ